MLRIALWTKPEWSVPWWIWIGFLVVMLAGISRFMWFLVIFTGYWIVFWQQYISLPGFIHGYINAHADVEMILVVDGLTVICLTLAVNFLTRKIPAFAAVILGTVITSLSWLILAFRPTIWGAVFSLFFLAMGEIIQAPRYYEYISRLAPPGQQGTYMGFAFVPIGIGSLIGGPFGGFLLHHFGEVQHQPAMIWFWITGIGLATAAALWVYDKFVFGRQALQLDFSFGLWDDSPPVSESEGRHYATLPSASRVFPRRMGSIGSESAEPTGAVRPAIEKLGGKIEAAWFSFGDYDVVVIVDLPDNVSAAAIAMAFAAGGACKSVQTIPLISPEEAAQALKKARECGYRPATATTRAA